MRTRTGTTAPAHDGRTKCRNAGDRRPGGIVRWRWQGGNRGAAKERRRERGGEPRVGNGRGGRPRLAGDGVAPPLSIVQARLRPRPNQNRGQTPKNGGATQPVATLTLIQSPFARGDRSSQRHQRRGPPWANQKPERWRPPSRRGRSSRRNRSLGVAGWELGRGEGGEGESGAASLAWEMDGAVDRG
jgi:hypothetical protein